ncbi:MAG: Uma2 family endonuclease [Trueperaceae bacterium]|nr:Uma2 family endonuclease [Trueperaceae bacterium]
MNKRPGYISVKDYLEGEKDSAVKHEYTNGEVWAMTGTSDIHNTIAGNVFAALLLAARANNCRAYISDMKIRVGDATFYYPDVVFTCEQDSDSYFKTMPCIVVEVVSRSTARIDQNEKRYAYQ